MRNERKLTRAIFNHVTEIVMDLILAKGIIRYNKCLAIKTRYTVIYHHTGIAVLFATHNNHYH